MIEEVTAFVVRRADSHDDLLLFDRPHVGVQIPAATVQEGETAAEAVIRHAHRIGGLLQPAIHTYLGSAQNWLPPERRLIALWARVYDRPTEDAAVQAGLPPGTPVRVLGSSRQRVRVGYTGPDTAYGEGWVDAAALTDSRRRCFYRLTCGPCAVESWTFELDGESLTAFWAPLAGLPPLPRDQAEWLSFLDLPYHVRRLPEA